MTSFYELQPFMPLKYVHDWITSLAWYWQGPIFILLFLGMYYLLLKVTGDGL